MKPSCSKTFQSWGFYDGVMPYNNKLRTIITVEPRYNEPLYNEVFSITNDFTPVIVKYMEKYLDIIKHLYREQILPVPGHFVISRFHCIIIIGMQGKKGCGLVQNRVKKSEDFGLEYDIIMKNIDHCYHESLGFLLTQLIWVKKVIFGA